MKTLQGEDGHGGTCRGGGCRYCKAHLLKNNIYANLGEIITLDQLALRAPTGKSTLLKVRFV